MDRGCRLKGHRAEMVSHRSRTTAEWALTLNPVSDDAISIARTFGVRSRAGNSLRQYPSFDSSLRQNIPVPGSPVGRADSSSSTSAALPPVPPKSPARPGRNSSSIDTHGSPVAGPSRLPAEQYATSLGSRIQGGSGIEQGDAGEGGSETPRSGTPTSSFYASPKRRQQGHINPRDSSLQNGTGSSDEYNNTPRAERRNPLDPHRTSDEGFDSRSNSTGPPSLRSQPPAPVDANLRSMPGVVGLGDGWAGGPQNQAKKRKLWFKKKSKGGKEEEDPLALWAIQENGTDGTANKASPRKAIFKEAWNRSISKFGSMPALVSGDQIDGAKASVKQLLSRSRLDLATKTDKEGEPREPVVASTQEPRKAKRRSVAFFGLSKSQIDVSSPRPAQPMDTTPEQTDRWLAQAPPSPTPGQHMRGFSDSARARDASNITPIAVPPRDVRRLSAPLSAPAGPGGLPPPWRPQSFVLPRPQPATPAPRPFSRHEDHEMAEAGEQEELRIETGGDHSAPSMMEGGSGDPQTSASSASAETPVTGSVDGRSLKHKRSLLFAAEGDHVDLSDSPMTTPVLMRPISSLSRAGAQTPSFTLPHNANPSTPGLDTLEDWATEGKRPASRLMSRRATASRSRESSIPPLNTKKSGMSLFDRLKQALAVPETPTPHQAFAPIPQGQPGPSSSEAEMEMDKDLPDLPSGSSTPLAMPGAFPVESPAPDVDRDLPASPYDITHAVAHQMLATPPPSRPTSRMTVRKRGLSGDLWSKRLSRINEGGDSEVGSRSSSRQEKRRSVSALAGRFGFTSMRRNSSSNRADDSSDTRSLSSFSPTGPALSLPALEALEFGMDDLGLDDILDENRRISLVRNLEASLPLPPVRSAPSSDPSTSPAARSMTMTISSSEATVLAAPAEIESPHSGSGSGHRHHPSTSTTATADDRDETVMTPAQLRKSLETSNSNERRRGSAQSDDSDRGGSGGGFRRQQWPTRGHHRGASMGSIGELAHDLLNSKPNGSTSHSKRASVVLDDEDEERVRQKVREERTMSFASGVSSLSSAMSIDEEEAGESGFHISQSHRGQKLTGCSVPMSAIRVASIQQAKSRQVELGSSPPGVRV